MILPQLFLQYLCVQVNIHSKFIADNLLNRKPVDLGGKIRVGSTLTVVDTIDPDLRVYRGIGSRPE